ncbi:MAG: 4-alpha-glucanotransferase [Ideonella sp.]
MSFESADCDRPLHHLADRLGVFRQYVSASGAVCTVSDASLRLLCGAMGFDASSAADVDASLARVQASAARLDPVLFARQGQALTTPWRYEPENDTAVSWQIKFELGGGISGHTLADIAGSLPTIRIALDDIAIGYHHLTLSQGQHSASALLIVAPQRCWTPPEWQSEARRDWSITTQLYSLRSQRNWGIGDFSDLIELAQHAAAQGASSIGLNPLHALFPANPRHLSPYSPSSRVFLNPLYIDVEAVPDYAHSAAARRLVEADTFAARLRAVRASELVDYEMVCALKLEVLKALFAEFRKHAQQDPTGERPAAFLAFKQAAGADLARFSLFEALQQHMVDAGAGLSWRAWPAAFRDTDSSEVQAFSDAHAEAVEFSTFLQWEADRQLGAAAAAMRALGMSTGVYRDVAVGVDPNGAEAWNDPALLVCGASIGAPPDTYNPKGQDWGLTPFNPIALQQRVYAPFIAAIRANMRHAGAVRIDHVIGLKRLFWVPTGAGPAAGGYVSYPYDQLMAIVALESQRHQCLVVGEDLGTVPDGFRDDAAARALLSYRVLMFERANGDGAFLPPSHYPELAAAAVSTHDLPTLSGLWAGRDLEWRTALALYPDQDGAQRDSEFRRTTRRALIDALQQHGELSAEAAARLASAVPPSAESIAELIEAAHCMLAKAPSRLMLVQIEDLAREAEQMNLPGTVDEHPNWRRKLGCSVAQLFSDPAVIRTAAAIGRGRASAASAGATS